MFLLDTKYIVLPSAKQSARDTAGRLHRTTQVVDVSVGSVRASV